MEGSLIITFFLKYLLVPIIMIFSLLILSILKKGKSLLSKKKLIVFVLVLSLFVALPVIFTGVFGNRFYPIGLFMTHFYFVLIGFLLVVFSHSNMFESIGFNQDLWAFTFSVFASIIVGVWIYYLIFEYISDLDYIVWLCVSSLWIIVPIFFKIAENYFIKIPTKIYKLWYPEKNIDYDYWETLDLRRLKEVNIKFRRNPTDEYYASVSSKIPEGVSIGQWFNRFIEDHDVKFPDTPIRMEEEDELFGWVFYKERLLTIFDSPIDFDHKPEEAKLKDNKTIIAKRVKEMNENQLDY